MNAKGCPLALKEPVARLALNGWFPAKGRFRQREGFTSAITPTKVFGTTAPWRPINWTVGGTTYIIRCGSDAIAFVNPANNYLYARTAGGQAIYSDPTNMATADIATNWGMSAPSPDGGTSHTNALGNTTPSTFAGGGYLYGATSYNSVRMCESPITWLTSVDAVAGIILSSSLQWLSGVGWSTEVCENQKHLGGPSDESWSDTGMTCDAKADYVNFYRVERMSLAGNYVPVARGTPDFARRVLAQAASSGTCAHWTDTGGQVEGSVFDYCTDVVPFCKAVQFYDGRWFYGDTGGYTIYYTPGPNPETYGANDYSVYRDNWKTLTKAQGRIILPASAGPIVAFAARGGLLLALCKFGAWPIVQVPGRPGLYGHQPDSLQCGCVSQATIADSYVGVWWVAPEGIVLWNGTSNPEIVSRHVLDVWTGDYQFDTTLTGACGAYDQVHGLYVCAVPLASGATGIFAMQAETFSYHLMHGDPLLHERDTRGMAYWSFDATFGTVTGLGFDEGTRKLIVVFTASGTVSMLEQSSTFVDGTSTAYAFGADILCLANDEKRKETKNEIAGLVYPHRLTPAEAQTMAVTVTPMRETDSPTTSPIAVGDLSWLAGECVPKPFGRQVGLARYYLVSLRKTDAYGMEIREVEFGTQKEIADKVLTT